MIEKVGHFLNHKGFTIFALVVMAYILGAQSDHYYKWTNPPKEGASHSIASDGSGYYAYLPQVLIYGTEHFEFADGIQRKYPGSKFFEGVSPYEGGKSDKYFVGTAICISPFFWTAHQITQLSGGEADGYSRGYEISVLIAAIAFWLLGALSLLTLLKTYGINRISILFGIIGLTFATNLNYYIVYDHSFSHVYTYGIVCFLLLQTKRFVDTRQSRHLIWIFFLLGMITIIRPTNLIVVLIIPFFFDSPRTFWNELKMLIVRRKLVLAAGILIFGSLVFLQFFNIHSQYGYWGFNAYSAEGFDYLLNPQFGEVLFGFRKGFFVYTPFMLLVFPALYFLYRWNKYFFCGFLLLLLVFVYITASWWCWYYGGSLGMRPMIDVYGIMIIPVILFFSKVKLILRTILIAFMAFMIHFNLVLNYQLMNAILHYAEMDKEKFSTIFMQTGDRFQWVFHMQQPDFDDQKYQSVETFWFNPVAQQWTRKPSHAEAAMKPGIYMQSFVYVPVDQLKTSDIAVKLRYQMLIGSEENIPKTLLFGYKNGEREELSVNFIGPQIPEIDAYYPVDADLYSPKKYSEFDSLEVVLENGEGKGLIREASCSFMKRK